MFHICSGIHSLSIAKSRQPIRKSTCRLGDIPGRSSEREADPAAAIDGVEIEARGHSDVRLGKEAPAEILAVAGQVGNFDIKVKSALGRREAGQTGAVECADQ